MQTMNITQIIQTMEIAVKRQLPVSVSVKSMDWMNLSSNFIAADENQIYLSIPKQPKQNSSGTQDLKFSPANRVELEFKLGDYTHIVQARIIGVTCKSINGLSAKEMLCLSFPHRMRKIQRRKFSRVQVPAGQNPQANLIFGDGDDISIFSGKIYDISAAGFQIDLPLVALEMFCYQPVCGVQLFFDKFMQPILVEARYCFCQKSLRSKHQATVGLEFVDLVHYEQGLESLRQICTKVQDYSKLNSHCAESDLEKISA